MASEGLFAAICDAEDSTAFAEPFLPTLKTWSKYLIEYGYDPEDQLCTDDFAGRLAHTVNLSIKAIMGIAGLSRILARMGAAEEAAALMAAAGDYSLYQQLYGLTDEQMEALKAEHAKGEQSEATDKQ